MLAAIALSLTPMPAPSLWEFEVAGSKRTALVYAPAKTAGAPLVLGFHGHGGNSRNAARSFRMHEEWPEAVCIYPLGLPTTGITDPEGKKPGWQKEPGTYEDRDLKLVDMILDRASKELKTDSKRVFAMGHSNGGAMTYLLWAQRADKFAAFGPSASVAGLKMGTFTPKPAIHIAGTNDQLVSYSVQEMSIKRTLRINGCTGKGTNVGEFVTRYESSKGAPFATYITNGTHAYPAGAPAAIVKFFKSLSGGSTPLTPSTKGNRANADPGHLAIRSPATAAVSS